MAVSTGTRDGGCRGPVGVALAAALGAVGGPLGAQQDPAPSTPGAQQLARRTCRVAEIPADRAPELDGRLDDACWQDAPEIGDLTMVEPNEGLRPTQRTVVKIVHDRDNLYFALYCYDDDPASIRATQRQRDAQLDPDDRVEILLDPFENRRTAYFFQIGAGGSIGDALVMANGTRFDKPWDVIFDGRARVTAAGWMAEVAVPFRSIPRKTGATSWGFNIKRHKRSAGEEYQWNNPVQSVPFFRVSTLGTVRGFGAIDDGLGVDLVPYVAGGVSRDRAAVDRGWDFDPDAGGDVFYRITPEMTLAATLFTDFAETENDARQINLNRFPLFFPEKRDFFLQGAGYFTFGLSGNEVLPFFSRRIGLDDDGRTVPLLAGLKLTGEAGPWGVGVLDVETDARGTVDERKNLAVARLRYAVDEETAVGVIGTNGDPTEDHDSQTFGVDLYHREPVFVGDLDLQVFASAIGTQASGPGGDGEDWALRLESRGREWSGLLEGRATSPDFDPALGFVRRRGVRKYEGEVGFDPRLAGSDVWRSCSFGVGALVVDDWDGRRQDLLCELEWFGMRTIAGDSFQLSTQRRFERVDDPFTLFDGSVAIAAADYWTTRHGLTYGTSDGRPLSVTGSASTGDFFDGDSTQLAVDFAWRAGALLHLGSGYSTAIVDLGPGRDFTTHIVTARADVHFDSRLSVYNLVQFDNESEVLGWQSRLRWIQTPGRELFVVLGANWLRLADESLVPAEQSLVFKVVHTLRF